MRNITYNLFFRIGIITILMAVLIAVFIFYGYNKFHRLLKGPEIAIYSPKNGALITSRFISLSGKARDIANISINGRKIIPEKNGLFRDNLLLMEGYNIIEVKGEDKFGREVKKILEVVVR